MTASLGKFIDSGVNLASSAIVLQGGSRIDLAVSAAAAQTAALSGGIYDVWCDVAAFIKVNPVANNVTVANGYLLRANNTIPVVVGDGDRIGAIAGGAGTLSAHKVN